MDLFKLSQASQQFLYIFVALICLHKVLTPMCSKVHVYPLEYIDLAIHLILAMVRKTNQPLE